MPKSPEGYLLLSKGSARWLAGVLLVPMLVWGWKFSGWVSDVDSGLAKVNQGITRMEIASERANEEAKAAINDVKNAMIPRGEAVAELKAIQQRLGNLEMWQQNRSRSLTEALNARQPINNVERVVREERAMSSRSLRAQ